MDKRLRISPVIFDEDRHTYTLYGRELHGITSMLRRQLFPDEYDNVPADVLRKAAERGTIIHKDTELWDMGFAPAEISDELKSYILILKENNLTVLESEYTVSDEEYFASNIDKVLCEKDGTISLADIKTTSTPNMEYVRWQLSIYAFLFELQNPGLHVNNLYLIWIRGTKKMFIPVERIPNNIVKELLSYEKNGWQFINPLAASVEKYPAEIINAERQLFDFEAELNKLKADKEKLLAGLLELMQKNNINSYKGTFVHLIRKKASTRESVDTSRLKKEHPDIYEQYKKTAEVKESLTLKIIK